MLSLQFFMFGIKLTQAFIGLCKPYVQSKDPGLLSGHQFKLSAEFSLQKLGFTLLVIYFVLLRKQLKTLEDGGVGMAEGSTVTYAEFMVTSVIGKKVSATVLVNSSHFIWVTSSVGNTAEEAGCSTTKKNEK